MKLLRLDPTGAIDDEFGVTRQQLESIAPVLDELRSTWIAATTNAAAERGAGFLRLPKKQLDDYTRLREASELGRVFKLANTIMDEIDAVVILATGGESLGPKAMIDACCAPYHNELLRGARGGKPRVYFEGNDLNNDATQAVLSRLSVGGYGEAEIERRWAIVVIDQSGQSLPPAIALRQFVAALRAGLPSDSSARVERLVIPITGQSGKLTEVASELGCEVGFAVHDDIDGRYNLLSPVGLLPAALLGFDCMKLLEGAVAMTDHFENSPADTNMVLQFVAMNHLLNASRGRTIRELRCWGKELESLGRWYEWLIAAQAEPGETAALPITTTGDGTQASNPSSFRPLSQLRIINNLIVEKCRTDPLDVGTSCWTQDGLQGFETKTLADLAMTMIATDRDSMRARSQPTIDIHLPTIDTFVLGQLFQMLMIATSIEVELKNVNPV